MILILIDLQKDFHPGGSLAIPNANIDSERICDFINKCTCDPAYPKINRVLATLDSHQKLHIAHPCFWISGHDRSSHPTPFTIISSEDIKAGKWKPRPDLHIPCDGTVVNRDYAHPSLATCVEQEMNLVQYCIEYTRLLEEKGRFKLCIWPEHCLIGTDGHSMVTNVRSALDTWCDSSGNSIEWILKGQNLLTEMFSCLAAEVPISKETALNETLLESIRSEDKILIAGQAMSHCVNYTVRDILNHMTPDERRKVYVFIDCMSSVPGFEKDGEEFLSFVKDCGAHICTSTDFLMK
jgi:nicotinamidase/pyrazinamidase